MDAFQVPKKVNRHVLKALNILSDEKINKGSVTTDQILNQVKYQMRNLVPVSNIDMVIQKSLKNLSDIGLINRTGPERFSIGNSKPSNVNKAKTTVNPFKPNGSRKRSINGLNPNLNRTLNKSEESLSGDEYDRSRKRLRTNTKRINYAGRSTELPKFRQHQLTNKAVENFLQKSVDMTSCNFDTFDQDWKMALKFDHENSLSMCSSLSQFTESQSVESEQSNAQQSPIEVGVNVVELYNKASNFDNDSAVSSNSANNSLKEHTSKEGIAHSNQDNSNDSLRGPTSSEGNSHSNPDKTQISVASLKS